MEGGIKLKWENLETWSRKWNKWERKERWRGGRRGRRHFNLSFCFFSSLSSLSETSLEYKWKGKRGSSNSLINNLSKLATRSTFSSNSLFHSMYSPLLILSFTSFNSSELAGILNNPFPFQQKKKSHQTAQNKVFEEKPK